MEPNQPSVQIPIQTMPAPTPEPAAPSPVLEEPQEEAVRPIQPLRATQMDPLRLPTGIVSTGDARRLRRDIAEMQETIQAIRIRTNSPVSKLPRLSRALEEFSGTNRLNFLLPDDRHQAEIFMDYVLSRAPVMHISFASEATRKFTTELVLWLRANFDSEMLVEIGLEPNMAAGCVVRTTNKVFDFSLSKHLEDKREMMMQMILDKIPALNPTSPVPAPAPMEAPAV